MDWIIVSYKALGEEKRGCAGPLYLDYKSFGSSRKNVFKPKRVLKGDLLCKERRCVESCYD